jgi:two-component system, chemotaxis family, CheB/CheR fusion protein
MNILVVDDNVDSADMLVLLLRALGYHGHAVYSGDAALGAALEIRPDVVILDLNMPGVDGFELARTLRKDEQLRNVRLIALSGLVFPHHRAASAEAGIDVHLAKPITIEVLTHALG